MTLDEIIHNIVLSESSEYTNDSSDAGGPTKYGITQATLSSFRGKHCTPDDVKALTETEATVIYKERYYHLPGFAMLPEPLQPVVTDAGVPSGPDDATRWLQEVLEWSGFHCVVDGKLGPETVRQAKAAYEAMGPLIINGYVERRIEYYKYLVEMKPSNAKYIKGWIARANRFRV